MQVAYSGDMEETDSPRKKRRRQRLELLLQEFGGAAQVARESGTPKSHFSALTAGARGIGDTLAAKLEAIYNKPTGWFDLPIPEGSYIDDGSTPAPIDLENNPEYPAIRRVEFKLSAGASGFGVEYRDNDGAPIVFQRKWYSDNGFEPGHLFAVRVANGSMEPGLYDGDTVVVNTKSTNPKDGIVFAVNYEGEMVIKRLIRDGGQWWLSSDNPNQQRYPRKLCDEHSRLIGEVVHKQSMHI
jgi:hypothetical protein